MIVMDTNVLSEMIRSKPDERVRAWMNRQRRDQTFATSISKAEMLSGVRILPAGKRRDQLAALVEALFVTQFGEALLPFDAAAADRYADLLAIRRRAGRPIGVLDAQIAAIALSRGYGVATRDLDGFAGIGLTLVDPWKG